MVPQNLLLASSVVFILKEEIIMLNIKESEKLSVMNFTRDSVKVAQFEKLKTYYNELNEVLAISG